MYTNNLILRTLTSPYPLDQTINSVLTHQNIDSNFIYLKSGQIDSGTTVGTNVVFTKNDGTTVSIDLSHIANSGTTVNNFFSGGTGALTGNLFS